MPEDPYRHPKVLVTEACRIYGTEVIARWCADLLCGAARWDDPDAPSLGWIGGAHALRELQVGQLAARGQDYWPRTWGARALLYAWVDDAEPAVRAGLADDAWRVREMCAKVVYHRNLGQASGELLAAMSDAAPRVRGAVVRALGHVGEAEVTAAIRTSMDDDDAAVRRQAESALAELRVRLDRDL